MRPIPKRLLIHTATLYQRVNVDKWGKGELNGLFSANAFSLFFLVLV